MKKSFTFLFLFCLITSFSFGQTSTEPSGSGTSSDPYEIASLENLYWLSQTDSIWNDSLFFIQTADIDASSCSSWNDGSGFRPIGSSSSRFNGNYDGQGHTISNLYFSFYTTNKYYVGLFGYTKVATIKGIGIVNLLISIDIGSYMGGLIGYAVDSKVSECFCTGTIANESSGSFCGGLIGSARKTTISYCYTNCDINGLSYVGNFIGDAYGCPISNCYAKGAVYGEWRSGGFIGQVEWGATINNCYAEVTLKYAGRSETGAFIGSLYAGHCFNSFWLAQTDSSVPGIDDKGASYEDVNNIGLSSEEFTDYSIFTAAGWDLMDETSNGANDYWGLDANQNGGTPFLYYQGYVNNPAPLIDSVFNIEASTATVNYQIPVIVSPVSQYGVCWNKTGSPTLNDNFTNEGTLSTVGSYASTLTELETGKTYYVRAYLINAIDTAYSTTFNFKSLKLPEISTLLIKNITDSLAVGNIYVSDLGIPDLTACGVCWSTTETPTIDDNYTDIGTVSDTGTFSVGINNLISNATYYVRAFATNKLGTVYGDELNFVAQNAILSAVDTLYINSQLGEVSSNLLYVKNTGEAVLVIDSIYDGSSLIDIDTTTANINAGDSLLFEFTYMSETITSDTADVVFYSNAGFDTIVVVTNTSYLRSPDAGNAIRFDGADDCIALGSPGVLDSLAMDNFSIEMWIKTTDKSTRSVLFGNYNGNPSINFEIHTDNGGGVLRTYIDGNSYMDDQSIADGLWHHVATVVNYDFGFVKIYIDGELSYNIAGLPFDKFTMSNDFYLGKDARDASHYYDGEMDEVRIWKKALSPDEVRSQYASLAGNEDGLAIYYRFDEESGNSVYDATGNGNNGTLKNGITRVIPSTAPIADPVFKIVPDSFSFGSLLNGQSDTIAFNVINSGGGFLHIDSINYNYSAYNITPASVNIASGDTADFEAVFAPDTVGDLSGYYTYYHNMGTNKTFTEAYCVSLPYFSITAIDSITDSDAMVHLQVDTLGVPTPGKYGICWNTAGSPTLSDNYIEMGALTDTGLYKLNLSELKAVTEYHVVGYIVNGTKVTYSNEFTFETLKHTPVITWNSPSDITYGTALSKSQLNATVDYAGTLTYTPDFDSILNAGEMQELRVAFTPDNTDSVFEVTKTVTINVAKANLRITPGNGTRIYGASNPRFSINYLGLKNGESTNVIDVLPVAICNALATSPVGTYSVIASGGEDNNYSFTYNTGTLTVEKAELTVTVDDTTRIYGSANPDFTLTYSGFVNDEDESVLDTAPTASCPASATSSARDYTIEVSGGVDNNYSFTYQSGSLTIEKATLTVTADDATRIYGSANPDFTLTYSGFVNGEDKSVLGIKPTISCVATVASNAGSYAIEVLGGEDDNYDFSYQSGTLTIGKATLMVAANNTSRTYGDLNPYFILTYTGFLNGDNESMLDVKPEASTTATPTSDADLYYINVNGGSDNNYNFTYNRGILLIERANLTVTAHNATRAYGEPNPDFTFTYSGFVNGDDISVLDIEPTISCAATVVSNAGSYAIEISGGYDDNYSFIYQNGILTITGGPAVPVDLSVADTIIVEGVDVCFNAENEITVAGSSTVTVENNATANFIAGSSVRFLPGFHAQAGSYVHSWITTDGSFCDAVAAASLVVYQPEEKTEEIDKSELNGAGEVITAKVYPNPGNGQFHVVLSGAVERSSNISIYNMQGMKVYAGTIGNLSVNDVSLKSVPAGLYLMEIATGQKTLSKKLIVR